MHAPAIGRKLHLQTHLRPLSVTHTCPFSSHITLIDAPLGLQGYGQGLQGSDMGMEPLMGGIDMTIFDLEEAVSPTFL